MMSIALDSNRGRINQGKGLIGGLSLDNSSMFDSTTCEEDQGRRTVRTPPMDDDLGENSLSASSSSSSSSIGKNSDLDSDGERDEAQSSYNGPLNSLEVLEEGLPIKKGISKFYNGKSKSFTSLTDISSSKEIPKPENAYTKKRKNLLASSIMFDKKWNNPLKGNVDGLSKRAMNSRRSMSCLAGAACSLESNTSENSTSSSSPPRLPPRHPQSKPSLTNLTQSQQNISSAKRSFSLTDLQYATAAGNNTTGPSTNTDERKEDR